MIYERKNDNDHYELLQELVKLSLWFGAHWKHTHSEEPLWKILKDRTFLFAAVDPNRESLFDVPHMDSYWFPLLQKVLLAYNPQMNPDDFEQVGWNLLAPFVGGRTARDLSELHNHKTFECYGNSCFAHGEVVKGELLEFHIANTLYPDSLFRHPDYVESCLHKLIQDAKEGGAIGITTTTWLNEVDRWVDMFPSSWKRSLSEPITDVGWHLGFWGQCLTSRQCFSFGSGDFFREHGHFRYMMRRGELFW